MSKKLGKQKATTGELAVRQGGYDVGHCKPPVEYQFQPGISGNPKGAPKSRTQLWTYICTYMAMTDAEIKKLKREEMTQVQQSALKLVRQAKAGKYCGSERLARYIVDREEGKATEHLIIDQDNDLSDEECEEIRAVLRKAYADAG